MAIFGNATIMLQIPSGDPVRYELRPATSADTALNYFFAILFILFFLIGVLISPLTSLFSFRQSANPSNSILFLVSLLDHIKLVYFPLVLIPKLLAPQLDLYLKSGDMGWVAHVNTVLLAVTSIEVFVIVLMSVVRYVSAKYSSLPPPFLYIASYIVVLFVLVMSSVHIFLFDLDKALLAKFRITQEIITPYEEFKDNVYGPQNKCKLVVLVIFLVLGVISGVLTTLRLVKKREFPDRELLLCTLLMNLWNIVVMAVLVAYILVLSARSKLEVPPCTVGHDFFVFSATYGFPLTQSVINTLCIAQMKAFREEMLVKMKVSPQETDNHSSQI